EFRRVLFRSGPVAAGEFAAPVHRDVGAAVNDELTTRRHPEGAGERGGVQAAGGLQRLETRLNLLDSTRKVGGVSDRPRIELPHLRLRLFHRDSLIRVLFVFVRVPQNWLDRAR